MYLAEPLSAQADLFEQPGGLTGPTRGNFESRHSEAGPAARRRADPDRPFVAVIDDDEGARQSTAWFLEGEGYRVLTFASGDAFLAARLPESPACALLDLRMPGRSGLDVLRALHGQEDAPPVVVLTGHAELSTAIAAMKLKAIDVIQKPYAPEILLGALDRAWAMRELKQARLTAGRSARMMIERLSERQRQVLIGVVHGRANKIIAWELGLSIRTVEAYRAQMLVKLGVRGTAEAVRMALAAGLGPIEQPSRANASPKAA